MSDQTSVDDSRLKGEQRRLPGPLLVLTVVTGVVDAVSYLGLGHVFVANMTGNVVFLGFAAAGTPGFSPANSLVATAAFLIGALAGGRMVRREQPARSVRAAALVKVVLLGAAALVAYSGPLASLTFVLIVLLAVSMGLQNAVARAVGLPDLTTTVLTMTLTGIAADSQLAGGTSPRIGRRIVSVIAMLAGAAVGAALYRLSAAYALSAGTACMALAAFGAHRAARLAARVG